MEGTVNARTLMIEASGRVTGDVAYETISIAAGARIDGRLARREALAAGEDATDLLIVTPTGREPEERKADPAGLFPIAEPKRNAAG